MRYYSLLNFEMKRIQTEFLSLSPKYDAELVDDNIYHWNVALNGPESTPYFGFTFLLEIKMPKNYPFDKPEISFKTQIYHPNVSRKGEICMGDFSLWKSQNTILELLNYVNYLLSFPDTNNPLEPQIASHYISNKSDYEEKARMLAKKYAS